MNEYNINQTTLKVLALYRNDYAAVFHLREISRRTEVDVKAIQLQLRKLEEGGVLVSTRRGRNKEYSMNLENSITKYHMILAETFVSIGALRGNYMLKKVATEVGDATTGMLILFGSFAKGIADDDSDVDLFLVAEDEFDADAIEDIGNIVGRRISIISSTKKEFDEGILGEDPFLREIVSNHVVLRGTDEFCEAMWRYHVKRRGIPQMVPEPRQGGQAGGPLRSPLESISGQVQKRAQSDGGHGPGRAS